MFHSQGRASERFYQSNVCHAAYLASIAFSSSRSCAPAARGLGGGEVARVRVMKRTKSVCFLEGAPLTFLRRRAALSRPLPGILRQPLRRLLRPRHLRSKMLGPARTHAARRNRAHRNRRGAPQGLTLVDSTLRASSPVQLRCTAACISYRDGGFLALWAVTSFPMT